MTFAPRRIGGLAVLAILVGAVAPLLDTPAASAAEIRAMHFPVEGRVSYVDDFGAPRPGGRVHQGNDLIGVKLQHELAANDGTITFVRSDASGTSGNMLILTDDAGWQYYYIHINNDTPGTDDGANPPGWRFAPNLTVGMRVLAGQFIAYMGDSGDAETTVPHLHFELHRPDGVTIDPYPSLQVASHSPAPVGRGVAANPNGGWYELTGDGRVVPRGGAPWFGEPAFGWDIARGIAVMPDGLGYVVLDGWGGLHKFGSAAGGAMGVLVGPYWRGWDIARAVAISPSGAGVAVLDGWGGIHTSGDAYGGSGGYWPGWDIARALVLTPSGLGSYVLDGWGGIHVAGDAVPRGGPYWPGWDVARGMVAAGADGYAVLDALGGVHPFGSAPPAAPDSWAPGRDWRAIAFQAGHYLLARADAYAGAF